MVACGLPQDPGGMCCESRVLTNLEMNGHRYLEDVEDYIDIECKLRGKRCERVDLLINLGDSREERKLV